MQRWSTISGTLAHELNSLHNSACKPNSMKAKSNFSLRSTLKLTLEFHSVLFQLSLWSELWKDLSSRSEVLLLLQRHRSHKSLASMNIQSLLLPDIPSRAFKGGMRGLEFPIWIEEQMHSKVIYISSILIATTHWAPFILLPKTDFLHSHSILWRKDHKPQLTPKQTEASSPIRKPVIKWHLGPGYLGEKRREGDNSDHTGPWVGGRLGCEVWRPH